MLIGKLIIERIKDKYRQYFAPVETSCERTLAELNIVNPDRCFLFKGKPPSTKYYSLTMRNVGKLDIEKALSLKVAATPTTDKVLHIVINWHHHLLKATSLLLTAFSAATAPASTPAPPPPPPPPPTHTHTPPPPPPRFLEASSWCIWTSLRRTCLSMSRRACP